MATERVSASGKNLRVSLFGHFMTVIFNFATRRIFLSVLGSECTGFSGLSAHILNFLTLIEPGFDAACAFCLYRPLAYSDNNLTHSIMGYLSKIYKRTGILTFIAGLFALPLALYLSKGSVDTGFATTVYLFSLVEMSVSYLIVHRRILPVSDQKSYIVTGFGYGIFITSKLTQLIVLLTTRNYIVCLACGIITGLFGELILYCIIGKMYPFIKKTPEKLPEKVRAEIKSKAGSLFFHKVGAILCGSVDNMAVFIFIGLGGGTMYSNYTMLSGVCLAFISIITGSVAASVGNLGVTGSRERMMKVYSTALFSVFALALFFALSLFFTYPIIVELWVGAEMVLNAGTTALFCMVMFLSALRRPTGVFLDGFGLFDKEKYKAIAEAVITLLATIILAPRFGIAGVLLGQLCGVLLFSFWYEPYILFKYGFRHDMSMFFRDMMKYIFALMLSFCMCLVLCLCSGDFFQGMPKLFFRIAVCGFSVMSVFSILFFDSERLSETLRYGKRLIFSLRNS
ncbi:MAG: polysaccharide biosynthesis C-terminal domain-containing protein [Clostridia bacterium]|nr:polysaccharide biosynthesis C-terminal domain-containing protein [Clostridia bacterium]